MSDPTTASGAASRVKGDPGGQLLVTPAGSTVVSTDALLASADRLRVLEGELLLAQRRVLAADAFDRGWPMPDAVVPALERLRGRCLDTREALGQAAARYTAVEDAVAAVQRDIAAMIAAAGGAALMSFLLRLIVHNPVLLAAGALVGWHLIPDGPDGRLGTVRDFMMANPELITSPEFARFVELASTSVDDAAQGFLGVPWWLAPFGEDEDQGVARSAMTVAALGAMFGLLRETPVTTDRVREAAVGTAPSGVRERLDRIPEGDQVRIERYDATGMPPRYVVYVGPTETFSPLADDEPWDLTSNVHGVGGADAGSLRAVELAMEDANIQPGDEVVLTGFSQGGLIATMVAGSGRWNVVGLETHAAPAGHIPLPDGMAGLAIRHTDDLVPAMGGPQRDHSLVQVERQAFRDGMVIPDVQAAPAHQRTSYERTADAVDAAESSVVREQIAAIDAFTADYLARPGGRATEFVYHADRVGG